jgi:voltage-gated potassium channel
LQTADSGVPLRAGTPVVVIDPAVETLAAEAEAGFLVLTGDTTDDHLLQAAGVSRAQGLFDSADREGPASTSSCPLDFSTAALFIVSRAVDEASIPKVVRAGANRAVSPDAIGDRQLAHLIHSPRSKRRFRPRRELSRVEAL